MRLLFHKLGDLLTYNWDVKGHKLYPLEMKTWRAAKSLELKWWWMFAALATDTGG